MGKKDEMARRHLDAKFKNASSLKTLIRPQSGWIRAIRDALGITGQYLADRVGISRPRVMAIEKDEVLGKLTLNTLEKMAEALGCELVYALVPRQPLEKMVYEQARKKALQILSKTEHTMQLENQGSSKAEKEEQLKVLIDELLKGSPSNLWDENDG
jgi:predicted DNA-binding mobile mystery protein A